MTNQVNPSTRNTAPRQPAPGLVRTIALAGIGLISMLGDRLEEAYERSLQRQSAAPGSRRGAGVSQLVFDEWESSLARLNLPTKSDIDALTRQMTALEDQIDQLTAQRAASRPEE
jgi:polyhydroxyalkanoate synthesis regulator phasin